MPVQSIRAYLTQGPNDGHCNNFYDWFCLEKELPKRREILDGKLLSIVHSPKINIDKHYVFYKNNCPCVGKLYDDLRICEMGSGDVVYTVTPKTGHTTHKNRAEIWGRENKFDGPILTGTWDDVIKFFHPDYAPQEDLQSAADNV